ncbi:MAG: Bax inhibitor-1 family protein [Candidatus Methylacidiphilales bacterium]|nr:Bax inhibitor-1 family protein [Candidatus Methylacidiphilales bacterium]
MDASYSYPIASHAQAAERGAFLQRTYFHTAGSILVFGLICALLVNTIGETMASMIAGSQLMWLAVLVGFMAVSWLADSWAQSDTSIGMQYAGLSLYIVAEAFLFTPLLYIATMKLHAGDLIMQAGFMTLFLFGGITAFAFISKKDFSWLGGVLCVGGFIAMGFIALSAIFGFSLGLVFSAAMMIFACGSILYTTSNMIHVYRTDQHVAASLALFSGIALLFWYIIQILLRSRD